MPQTGSGLVEIALHAFVQVSAISYGRFYSKNGVPVKINFDQGSNFKAFDDNLTVISEVITKNRFFSYKGVFWDQSPTTRSITTPNFNDWVFIKDKFIDLGLVKIIEQIDSINGELRKTDLETVHSEHVHPVTNLRFLKCHPNLDVKGDLSEFSKVESRQFRQTAQVAKVRIKQMSSLVIASAFICLKYDPGSSSCYADVILVIHLLSLSFSVLYIHCQS